MSNSNETYNRDGVEYPVDSYSYLGYRYEVDIQDEDDCRKFMHTICYEKTGRYAGHVEWSPYKTPSVELIRQTIEGISETNCEAVAAGFEPECYKPFQPAPVRSDYADRFAAFLGAEQRVNNVAPRVQRGGKALVVKGRKIEVGTEVSVFWYGTCRNKFTNAMETRAGVVLPDGSKVFTDAGNLDPMPTEAEMAVYLQALDALQAAEKALAEARVPAA